MRGMVPPDPASSVSQIRYAVVYVPKRSRKRFSQGCVEVVDSDWQAMSKAAPEQRRFAALVSGPSKSSEGQLLYYLVEWLGEEP
ncbi:MAG: hypothetical protein DSZ33_04425 [Gammaproteobacteria bacterium]|nr:MAG: hypothetical protein DSZ33_04425 [Gammaproteobacteria bacterium]